MRDDTNEILASVFIVDGVCWSGGGLGNPSCRGTKETIEQCAHCLRYLPVNGETNE